jgi:hypothetical protein
MASFNRLPSGRWRVQVRRNGHAVSRSFRLKEEAQTWAQERPLAAAALANSELFLAINAVDLLVIHQQALAPKDQIKTPVAEPPARQSQ